jgi:hypothetical protein
MGRSRETDEWGVGEKVSVDVGSLEKLAKQIKDDWDSFHEWAEGWQQTRPETNPANAQFTRLAGANTDPEGAIASAVFKEAAYLEAQNNGVLYNHMRGLILLMEMGLKALHDGSNFLASMYPGVDGYNNVQLGTVQDAFPSIPIPDPSKIDASNPPGAGWKPAADGKGWDTNGDNKTDVPYLPSGAAPANLDKGKSVNDKPGAVAADTHSGYQKAIDTRPGGDLDGATQRDLRNNEEEGESNMPIVRGLEDAWDWTYETAEAVENFTDGEDDPRVPGRW